jgi:hypothetical protein
MPWCAAHNQGNGAGPHLRYGIGAVTGPPELPLRIVMGLLGHDMTRVPHGTVAGVTGRPRQGTAGYGTGAGPTGQVALTRPVP